MSEERESELLIQRSGRDEPAVNVIETDVFTGVHVISSDRMTNRKVIKIAGDEIVSEMFGRHATRCTLDRSLTKAFFLDPAGYGAPNCVVLDLAANKQLFAVETVPLHGKDLDVYASFNLSGTRLCLSINNDVEFGILQDCGTTAIYDTSNGDMLWSTEIPVGEFALSFDDRCLLTVQYGYRDTLTIIPILVGEDATLHQPQPRRLFEGLELFIDTIEIFCHPNNSLMAHRGRASLTVVDYVTETQLHHSTYTDCTGEACFGAYDTIMCGFDDCLHGWNFMTNTLLFKVPSNGYYLAFNFSNNTFVSGGYHDQSVAVHDATSGELIAKRTSLLGNWDVEGIYCTPAVVIRERCFIFFVDLYSFLFILGVLECVTCFFIGIARDRLIS